MKNYTILENNLKDEATNYIKNITLGLGKVDTHFITDMFVRMLKHNSVILSDIVRQTGNINIKKGVERLERNLDSFDNIENVLMSSYIQMVKPYINNRHLYFVDRGDIVKKDNTKFENKGFVLDDRTLNEAYMVLLTSRTISGKAQALQIVRDYALRWKIEENFKYKKQQFEIEKIKVRRYKRIQVLNTLLTYVMFFSNVINLKAIGKTIRKIKNQIRDKILFWLYRISDGIKEIISFFSAELLSILYPSRNKRRRDLWTVMGVRYNPA